MPKLMDKTPMETYKTLHDYKYTGQVPEKLGGSKYTLVSIVLDASPSISDYVPQIEEFCRNCVLGAKRDKQTAGQIMVRLTTFNDKLDEFHGFKELNTINPDDYKGIIQPNGITALYEATYESILATKTYGEQLVSQSIMCNAVLFIITDGQNNVFNLANPDLIKTALKKIKQDEGRETVESINVILIAATDRPDDVTALKTFLNDAGLNQFIEMGEANDKNLARAGGFISKSVSSTSRALGTCGPSQPIAF